MLNSIKAPYRLVLTDIISNLSKTEKAMIKAFLNAFLIPAMITFAASNILIGLCWVILISVIYKKVHTHKKLNAIYFFRAVQLQLMIISLLAITIII